MKSAAWRDRLHLPSNTWRVATWRESVTLQRYSYLAAALLPLLVACGSAHHSPRRDTQLEQGPASEGGTGETMGGQASQAANAAPDWCAVQPLLHAKCQRCHADPPLHGAPFALVSYDDAVHESSNGTRRIDKIQAVVEQRAMPPSFVQLDPPAAPLDDDERALLLDWCQSGAAPAPSSGCPE